MNQSLTHEEIRKHQHPLLPNPHEYQVVRYEVDVDPDRQAVTCIILTLRSGGGARRRLRFLAPSIPQFGPFQIPLGLDSGSVYVVDTGFKGWESRSRIGADHIPSAYH
jgi:hypothetical protein